ncbi:BCCT family transporter [Nocardiopsis dassonvillei]|uniref:BCCT transporter n=2 Tax=Nocardiopsidaceae TaxID=83676 RepID=D7AWU0_NOCDD|nr:BCCT transporter [Nocardiopsis dassonvillei subsp. dassonvillei DSM 43111]APC36049.1 BCCT transporter [Nocardiopsis dassonvillei]NKY82215.1 BCCT family transporter [Nocardiopsis dassonvillei]
MFSTLRSRASARGRRSDPWVMSVSGALMTAFVLAALVAPRAMGSAVDAAFTWSARWFGAYWQLLMLATFVVMTVLAFSRYGRVRMGGTDKPEFKRFTWIAMVVTTLLAAGGVFWAAAEPIAHYASPPPQYADQVDGGAEGAAVALAQSFVHWGFIGWAVGGALATLVMMRGVEKGMPLRPRTLLWPLLGERVRTHWIGAVADISCVLAVVAGTVGPIGFLGLQISYICSELFGLPDTYAVQALIILGLTAVAAVSVLSGIHKGIQLLSRANVWVALALIAVIVGMASLPFVVNLFLQASAVHAREFLPMALYRGDEQWLGYWTLFFFGWFLGFGPMMAVFFARISRGRTVRDIYVGATVVPSVVTMLWFTALGGTGIWLEQREPGTITGPYAEDGLPAAALAILEALPLTGALGVLMVVVALIFLASTLDSMSYTIAVSSMHEGEPSGLVRAFWCVGMGLAAVALLLVGDGGIQALQSFIVVTAVPVGLLMLPTLWTTHPLLRDMAVEQGIVAPRPSRDGDGDHAPRAGEPVGQASP